MPQTVLRPARKTGGFPHAIQLSARAVWRYLARQTAVRAQPRRKIRLYRDRPPSRALCLCCFHFDVSTREIDFVPLQSFYLGIAQPRKRANGEHWKNAQLRTLRRL